MNYFCKNKQNTKRFSETTSFLKALSDENRLKIICFLKKNKKCVCEIVNFLNLPQNLVSHHLKVLREQKIVLTEKDGLKVFYFLNKEKFKDFKDFFNFLILK